MKLTIYRILSFLLLPVAVLFSISFLVLIPSALANAALLLPLFLFGCIAIYSFASLNFLIRGIDGKKYLGKSSKDWLKVNAYVSILFALIVISECVIFILHPEVMNQVAAQAKQNAGAQFTINEADLKNLINITSYFFLVYAIVLFIHVLMSFQYIKTFDYLFQSEKQ